MNIAVLSGKGGTGKTTISTNLALAMEANYIDCDVEEPNGFVFLKPDIYEKVEVMSEYPMIDKEKCTLCGDCVDACQFNALAKVGEDIVVFNKLCHSCGACEIACKYDALHYANRKVGLIERGIGYDIDSSRGVLDIGEPIAVTVIRELLKGTKSGINIIDCPPGTSCNVVTSLRFADSAILVTEPTKFGLHDLDRAVKLVNIFNIPFSIIINKGSSKDNMITEYCKDRDIPILGSIPYSSDIALAYSNGDILYELPKTKVIFDDIVSKIEEVFRWI
ncbi:MAG: P-loop NTPase [Clostridiales bacterium]|nr:P-loop NTPase [Clostridiales bacterium]